MRQSELYKHNFIIYKIHICYTMQVKWTYLTQEEYLFCHDTDKS